MNKKDKNEYLEANMPKELKAKYDAKEKIREEAVDQLLISFRDGTTDQANTNSKIRFMMSLMEYQVAAAMLQKSSDYKENNKA